MVNVVEDEVTWQSLLGEARTLAPEHPLAALQLCDRAALLSADGRYRAALLRGDILLELGDAAGALSCYESIADIAKKDSEVDCARGLALFHLARFAESENALRSALRDDPDLAPAHFALGVMAEVAGTGKEIEHFRRARRLDPERFFSTPKLSNTEFEKVVEEALLGLSDELRDKLDEVLVLVAPVPRLEDLQHEDGSLSPLCKATKVALATSYYGVVDEITPPRPAILLFKRNVERVSRDREALVAAVAAAVREAALTEED